MYSFSRFGFVEYASVDEARAVFEKPENVILDGRIVFIDYASRAIDEKPGKPLKRNCYCIHTLQFSLNIS